MEVEQPPSYSESSSPIQMRRPPESVVNLGPPPPYSSQEELLTSLLQTDADGSQSTELELPPSYEEVIAGLSNVCALTDLTDGAVGGSRHAGLGASDQAVSPGALGVHAGGMASRSSWSGPNPQHTVTPTRRVIHIPKARGGTANQGYGFAFRGNRVTIVLPNSPASNAGLRQDLILIEVNRINVEGQGKEFILQQIKSQAAGLSLLVEDPVVWSQPSFSWLTFTIRKTAEGYGFAFRGAHISVVLPNSEAAQAGLCVGDTLLKINGIQTHGLERAGLLDLIHMNQQEVQVTVTRRGQMEHQFHFRQPTRYTLHRSPVTGYGFAFRGTRISALIPGSDAETKGLRIGDRIVEINNHLTHGCKMDEILRFINERRDDVNLVVVPDVTPMSNG